MEMDNALGAHLLGVNKQETQLIMSFRYSLRSHPHTSACQVPCPRRSGRQFSLVPQEISRPQLDFYQQQLSRPLSTCRPSK